MTTAGLTLTDRIAAFRDAYGLVIEQAGGLFGGSAAAYDGEHIYRYVLARVWGPGPVLVWVMLNPSTATAFEDDPTVNKCWRRAARLGYGGIIVVNLFAFRATDPAVMLAAADPVGPVNDACLTGFCTPGTAVVAAWGAHGNHLGRASAVTAKLTGAGVLLQCLDVTKDGEPKHPLYLPMALKPVPYERKAVAAA